MATLLELRSLFKGNSTGDLLNRVDAAVIIEAKALLDGTPTANDQKWVSNVLADPRGESEKVFKFILAANKDSTVAQIEAATDAQIQNNVSAVVPSLVSALSA